MKQSRAGVRSPNWKGGVTYTPKGYRCLHRPGHPRAGPNGYVPEHILLAEKAFGKPLPPLAVVHHVTGRKHGPLVICQDEGYHQLTHARLRAFLACGNPRFRKCVKRFQRIESYVLPNSVSTRLQSTKKGGTKCGMPELIT